MPDSAEPKRARGDRQGIDEIRKRLVEVEDEYLRTMSVAAARRFAIATWGVSAHTAYRYTKAVIKTLEVRLGKEREHRRTLHLAAAKRRIAAAEKAGEWPTVATLSTLAAKLEGVLEPSSGRLVAERTTTTIVSDRGALIARQVERLSLVDDAELDAVERLIGRVMVELPAATSESGPTVVDEGTPPEPDPER